MPHTPQDEGKQPQSPRDTSSQLPDTPARPPSPFKRPLPPEKGEMGASSSKPTETPAAPGLPPKQRRTTPTEDASARLPTVQPFPPMNEQLRPVYSLTKEAEKDCLLLYTSLVVNDEKRAREAPTGKRLLLNPSAAPARQDPPALILPRTTHGAVPSQSTTPIQAPPSRSPGGPTGQSYPTAVPKTHTIPRPEDFAPPLPTEGHEKYLSDLINNPQPLVLTERNGFRHHNTISLLDDAKHGGASNLYRCISCGEMQRVSPLKGCRKGHLTCPSCRDNTSACGICRDKEFSIPLENLEVQRNARRRADECLWPCQYRRVGCLEEFCDFEMSWHVATCGFRATTCPAKCNWKGHLMALPEHLASGFCADIVPICEPTNCFFGFFRDHPHQSVLVDHRPFRWTQQYLLSAEHADLHLAVKFYYHNGVGEISVSADVPSHCMAEESIMVRLVLFPADTRISPWAANKTAPVEHFLRHSTPGVRTELFDPPLTTNATIPLLTPEYEARIQRGRQAEAHYLRRLDRFHAAHPETKPPGQQISQPRIPSKTQGDRTQAAEGPLATSEESPGPDPPTAAQDKVPTPATSGTQDPTSLSCGASEPPKTSKPPSGGAFGKASVGMGQLMHAELMASSHCTYSASGPPASRSMGERCYNPKSVRLSIDQTRLKCLKAKGMLFVYSIQVFRNAKTV